MEHPGRATRTHPDPTKHTLWHYSTTVHPEAVTQIKEALSLTLLDTHNAHQPGMFTMYWNPSTDTGMVPQVPGPQLPPTDTALAKAAKAMVHSSGAQQDSTPNVVVEQRAHHKANKEQQEGRQIHPLIRVKDGNLKPHRPWIVHSILEDHGSANHTRRDAHAPQLHRPHLKYARHLRRSTEVHVETAGRHRRQSVHGVHLVTIRGPASPHLAPGPVLAPTPPWEASEPSRRKAPGEQRHQSPPNIINSTLANAKMPLIDTGCPTADDATHCRTWGTIRRALHHDIDCDQATWIDQGSVSIRVGGWLNTPKPQQLHRVAGPYILYPVAHGMDDHCRGLCPGHPPCGHPCPHALCQPLEPQPAPLPGIYLNTVTGAKGVYLTTGDTTGQAVPLDQVHHMTLGPLLPNTDKPRHPMARHGKHYPRPVDPNAQGPDRALLHLTMKNTAQLPATLAGEKYFIVEGLTDDISTLAANTLAATTDAWDDAVGHPTARKDRVQGTEDSLTLDLANHLVNPTSPPEQHNLKTEGPKVTDWTACDFFWLRKSS